MRDSTEKIMTDLAKAIDPKGLVRNASMKEYTSLKAGGSADLLVIPKTEEELRLALAVIAENAVPCFIMGNGTNLLVRDGGYRGVIVKIGADLSAIKTEEETVFAEAGALLSVVAAEALSKSLSGFEFASGIPGSLGGAVFMNAGAYGGEMKHVVSEVNVVSADGKRERTLSVSEMAYGYRSSALMETGELVLSAKLRLTRGDRSDIAATMKELTIRRNEKQPVCYPSAGSFFKRPQGLFAGKLIEEAGLKGERVGGASISTLHAGFLINDGRASASDILALMEKVQQEVHAQFGVMLEPEVRIIGETQE